MILERELESRVQNPKQALVPASEVTDLHRTGRCFAEGCCEQRGGGVGPLVPAGAILVLTVESSTGVDKRRRFVLQRLRKRMETEGHIPVHESGGAAPAVEILDSTRSRNLL